MQDTQDDNDLIPDVLKEPPKAPVEATHEYRELDQVPKRPFAKEIHKAESKKQGVLGRPKDREERLKMPGGDIVDLSKGPIKRGLFEKSAANFEYGVQKQFKQAAGSRFTAAQRKAIAKVVRKDRSRGLYSGEIISDFNKLLDKGILKSKGQVRAAKRIVGAKRSSSFF